MAVAAGLAFLLAVAGAIGGLAQLGGRSAESTGGEAAMPSPAPDAWKATHEVEQERLGGLQVDQRRVDCARCGHDSGGPAPDLTKIVREGSIIVVVPAGGFGDAFDDATSIAEQAGGFVLSSSIDQERQGTLTLRVPADRLDGAVVKLRALGRLADLTMSGRDVTADYVDLKARLGVLKTQRDLIVKLLNEATTVSGTIGLSQRFTAVQTQIERLQGSLNVLNDKVDLATMKVTLREEGVAPAEVDDVRPPSLGSAWDRAVQGFVGVIAAVVVGLGYLLPLLAVAGVVVLVRRGVIRRRAAS